MSDTCGPIVFYGLQVFSVKWQVPIYRNRRFRLFHGAWQLLEAD